MATIFEIIWEKRFVEEHGREPTPAERTEVQARINNEREERRAAMTEEQRKSADEFVDGAFGILRRIAAASEKEEE